MQDQISLVFGHLTARMDTFKARFGKVEDIAINIKVEPFSPEVRYRIYSSIGHTFLYLLLH